jgi:hypothetical protein
VLTSTIVTAIAVEPNIQQASSRLEARLHSLFDSARRQSTHTVRIHRPISHRHRLARDVVVQHGDSHVQSKGACAAAVTVLPLEKCAIRVWDALSASTHVNEPRVRRCHRAGSHFWHTFMTYAVRRSVRLALVPNDHFSCRPPDSSRAGVTSSTLTTTLVFVKWANEPPNRRHSCEQPHEQVVRTPGDTKRHQETPRDTKRHK